MCWDWLSCISKLLYLRKNFHLVAWTLLENSGKYFKCTSNLLMDSVPFLDYKD